MSVRKQIYSPQIDLKVLIKEIKNRHFLWNTEDEHYNDRSKNAMAWSEISQVMHTPDNVLRAKWKNLRDLFRREMKKFSPATMDDYTGKWRYFNYLWFLHRPDEIQDDNEEHSAGTDNANECAVKIEPDNEFQVYIDDNDDIFDKKRPFEETITNCTKRIKTEDEDFDMMFLKSLTPYFRAIEPMRKLVVRNKIQQILLDELTLSSENGHQ